MSGGSGSKGDDRLLDVTNSKLGCPAFVNDHDSPKVILGVAPSLQDGFAVEGDFATCFCFVKKYLTAHVTQGSNGEEIVDKAGEAMS